MGAVKEPVLAVSPVTGDFNWETAEPHKFRPFKPIYYMTMGNTPHVAP